MNKIYLPFIITFLMLYNASAQDYDKMRERITTAKNEIELLKAKRKSKVLRNAYYEIGKLYYEDRQYTDSALAFEEILRLKPTKKMQKDVYVLLGKCYEGLKEYEKAILVYKRALELMPKNMVVYVSLGRVYCAVELFDQSKDYYQKTLDMNSDNVEALEGLGFIYMKRGFFDKAISYYEQAKTIDPNNDVLLIKLSEIYERQQQYTKAVDMQLSAINILPSSERYNRLGSLYVRVLDYDTALKYFYHARDLNPADQEAYVHIGIASFKKGALKESADTFNQAIILDNRNALAYFYRAQVLYRMGNIKAALADAENAHTYAQSSMITNYSQILIDALKASDLKAAKR